MFDMTQLTAGFRHVHLELAREKGHPDGDRHFGYDLVVPLDDDGRLDAVEWKAHRNGCRVRRFHEDEEDRIGQLRRKRDGHWFFDYAEGEDDDEVGFRLGTERFIPGEYVSIFNNGLMRTFRVVTVERL